MTSQTLQQAINAGNSEVEICTLFTMSHPDLTDDIRVTDTPLILLDPITFGDDVYGVISRGQTFIYLGFQFVLPSATEQLTHEVPIEIDNVGRDIMQPLLEITSPPTLLLEVVRADAPDQLELVIDDLTLRDAKWSATRITATLTSADITQEPYPKDNMTPSRYPGVFKGVER